MLLKYCGAMSRLASMKFEACFGKKSVGLILEKNYEARCEKNNWRSFPEKAGGRHFKK
jgi:hypothetical protein